ncbi:hypothetical protein ROHU_010684 [Labeo rohita]|uniref:Uncharacterized protein n=1 Tax=Labeo rohita TaxID=84645 RepID=A0A498LTV2_LABRO|nr:hypothetical protein ROHU_010684 [Labeo rohita]
MYHIATQQNQTSEDQSPFVTISPVETSSQVFADVEREDDLNAPDGSLQQQAVKESTIPHGSSILHKVEVNVQEQFCNAANRSGYLAWLKTVGKRISSC